METKTLNPSHCRAAIEEPQTSLKPFQDPENTTKSANQSETPLIALTQHVIAWERTKAAPTLPAMSTPRHSYPSQAFQTTLPCEIQFIFMFLIWQSRSQPNVHDSSCHCRRKPCYNEQSHHWCISTYWTTWYLNKGFNEWQHEPQSMCTVQLPKHQMKQRELWQFVLQQRNPALLWLLENLTPGISGLISTFITKKAIKNQPGTGKYLEFYNRKLSNTQNGSKEWVKFPEICVSHTQPSYSTLTGCLFTEYPPE